MGNEISVQQTNRNTRRVIREEVRLHIDDVKRLRATIGLFEAIVIKLKTLKMVDDEMYESSTYSSGPRINISEREWVNKYMQQWQARRGHMTDARDKYHKMFRDSSNAFTNLTKKMDAYEVRRAALWKSITEYRRGKAAIFSSSAGIVLDDVLKENTSLENILNSAVNKIQRDSSALGIRTSDGDTESLAKKWDVIQRENSSNNKLYIAAYNKLVKTRKQMVASVVNYHTIEPPYKLDLESILYLVRGSPNEKRAGYDYIFTLILREILYKEKIYTTNKQSGNSEEMLNASIKSIFQ